MGNIVEALTERLGPPVEDAEEETFMLYSRPIPSSNLGFIDPKAESVDVTIRDREFVVYQSPGILSSSRAGGTTGAVLWKITPLFAEWISSPGTLALLRGPSSVLELGCGISPLNGLALAAAAAAPSSSPITRCVLTDQSYVAKLVNRNLEENAHHHRKTTKSARGKRSGRGTGTAAAGEDARIEFAALDWETDSVAGIAGGGDFDLVLACDCVYNEALIPPLTQTCADACALRGGGEGEEGEGEQEGRTPTLCVVAQQLRDDTVFQSWLQAFQREFVAWRVPDGDLPEGLRPDDGFVIYIGVLRSCEARA